MEEYFTVSYSLTEEGRRKRAELLQAASEKLPITLNQIDCFYMPDGGDSVMQPDENGWCLMGGQPTDLFNASWDIRVLWKPGADKAKMVQALEKAIKWAKGWDDDGFHTMPGENGEIIKHEGPKYYQKYYSKCQTGPFNGLGYHNLGSQECDEEEARRDMHRYWEPQHRKIDEKDLPPAIKQKGEGAKVT